MPSDLRFTFAKSPRAFLSLCVFALAPLVAGDPTNSPALTCREVQFDKGAPYASDAEFRRRLGYTVPSQLQYPTRAISGLYSWFLHTNRAWGLLIWVSPSDQPGLPGAWKTELATREFLVVCAYNGGNNRHPIDRCRLALDATCNLTRQYRIDPQRIYVGGFSGGGRMASILGVAFADLFAGAVAVCGVDSYLNVPAAAGGFYPPTYKPDPRVLARAKTTGRYVLLTGELDMNRDNTQATALKGLKPDGFAHVLYLEVAGMKHALPTAPVLGKALEYLEQKAAD